MGESSATQHHIVEDYKDSYLKVLKDNSGQDINLLSFSCITPLSHSIAYDKVA